VYNLPFWPITYSPFSSLLPSVQGITDTAQTIYETAAREHESRGVTGAVGEVLRQIPPAVVKPIIVATEATSNVLGGMRNQIRPDVRQDESQKWRHGED
jgi:autophagy-related protein 2